MTASTLYRHAIIAATVSIASLASPSMALAQQRPADAIIGKWAADDGTSKLDMYDAGDEYRARLLCGNQLIEADGVTMKKDLKNPDPALRGRSLKNIVFATRLRYADGEWTGGSIYDAASGRTYRCKASIKDGKLSFAAIWAFPRWGGPRRSTGYRDRHRGWRNRRPPSSGTVRHSATDIFGASV